MAKSGVPFLCKMNWIFIEKKKMRAKLTAGPFCPGAPFWRSYEKKLRSKFSIIFASEREFLETFCVGEIA